MNIYVFDMADVDFYYSKAVERLIEIYESRNTNPEQLSRFYQLKLKIESREKVAENAYLEEKIAQIKENNERELKLKSLENVNTVNNFLYAIAIFMVVISLLLVVLFLQKNRENQQVKAQKEFQDQLLTIVGHDLRSPLMSTYGLTQEAEHLVKEQRYEHFPLIINAIERSHSNMNLLLSNLLSWIRLYQEQKKSEKIQVNLSDLLLELSQVYGNLTAVMQTKLVFDVPENLNLETLKDEFSVVLRNGLDNAIKHSKKNTVSVYAFQERNQTTIFIKNKGMLSEKNLTIANEIFKQKKLDKFNTVDSFGFILMARFARKINAKLQLSCKDGKTILEISL